ncbi:MAG: cysteine desulfurase [Candidatus Hydrothermarchaeales archaeon]
MKIELEFDCGRDLTPISDLWENLPKLSVKDVRNHLPMTRDWIYLDNAATSLTPNPIWQEMARYYSCYNANVERGAFFITTYATEVLHKAHQLIAKLLLNCKYHEFIFTKNLTEGMNMIAYSLSDEDWRGKNIVFSDIEHHSNILPWIRLARKNRAEIRVVETDNGVINPNALDANVDENTALVTLQHCSNVTGAVQDIKAFSKICRENDALFAVDGSQAPGHMPVDVKKLGCDFYGFSGHKGPMGPVGSGGLYVKEDLIEEKLQGNGTGLSKSGLKGVHKFEDTESYVKVKFKPMEVGGGTIVDADYDDYILTESPSRYQAGTPNIAGEIGLGRAAVYVSQQIGLTRIKDREKILTRQILDGLSEIDNVEVYGPLKMDIKIGVVSFNIKGWVSHDVSLVLDETHNICTRAGSHCVMPWHKKQALQDGTVRASVHYYNTEGEVDKFIDAIKEISETTA